jgi:hypothetical protein
MFLNECAKDYIRGCDRSDRFLQFEFETCYCGCCDGNPMMFYKNDIDLAQFLVWCVADTVEH